MSSSIRMGESDAPGKNTPAVALDSVDWWRPVLPTLTFLGVPTVGLLLMRLLQVPVPIGLLYAIAGLYTLILATRSASDPEWLLAVFVIYLPFSKTFVAPVAPGVNGTNVLFALVLLAWIVRSVREKRPMLAPMPFNKLVTVWAVLSLLSIVTAMMNMGAWFITTDRLPQVKGWCDQFFVFFALINLIRDGKMARRLTVYMVIGLALVVVFGFDEWQDKRYYDRIEKARLLGPHQQPNDLGAFIVYGFGIPGAWILMNLWRLRTWVIAAPMLYMSARVLLATFSRGSVIGMGALFTAMLLVRGRLLACIVLAAAVLVVEVAPEMLPESLSVRLSQTTNESDGELDKSSQTRIILWNAALSITQENPILGTGFATFPSIKDRYTSVPTVESDNHNMFLFIASQMGVPTLISFLLIVGAMFMFGTRLYSRGIDASAKTIGLGTAATAVGVVGINMFGSRMVDIGVCSYVWITLAVLSHLWSETRASEDKRQAKPQPLQQGFQQ